MKYKIEVLKIVEYIEDKDFVYFAYNIENIHKISHFKDEFKYFVGDYMNIGINYYWRNILKIESEGILTFLKKENVEDFKIKIENFINGYYFKIIHENILPKIMSNVTFYSPKEKCILTGLLLGHEITTKTNEKNECIISKGFLIIEINHDCGFKECLKTSTWIS